MFQINDSKESRFPSEDISCKRSIIQQWHIHSFCKYQNDDQIPVEKEDDEKIKKSSSEKEVSTNAKKNEKKSKKSEKQIPSSGSRVRIGCEEVYEPPGNSKTQMDLNLSLRAALYGVLFQIYADMVHCRFLKASKMFIHIPNDRISPGGLSVKITKGGAYLEGVYPGGVYSGLGA